jgi:hypothetical protein
MKAYRGGGCGCIDPHFLNLGTSWEWSASRPGRFIPGEKSPGTHSIGGRRGPRAGLDDVEKGKFLTLPGLELRPLRRPARSQSLYRLRYPGSQDFLVQFLNTKFRRNVYSDVHADEFL